MTLLLAAGEMDFAAIGIGSLGGLALFLFGMIQMTDALKQVAGNGMRNLLVKLTKNRFMGAITGGIVTAIWQSSSVTTVLLVGFITAGLMTLGEAISVILGANVGSTVTAQLIAFKVTALALPLIIIGFALNFISNQEKVRQIGAMILGFGLVFYGMLLMTDATQPLRDYPPFIEAMQRMDNPLLAITVSAVITAIVQSSSATIGIVIVLASQGYISLEAGIALALGANIGTCVTAVLAATGKPAAARQAAAAHVLFNVAGVLIWTPLIPLLADIVRMLATETPRQIANAHTTFNLMNTLIFIGFTGQIARVVQWMVPEKPGEMPVVVEPRYLDKEYLQTPSLALDRVRLELGHMGQHVISMIHRASRAVVEGSRRDLRRVSEMDDDVDKIYAAIVDYVRRLAGEELTAAESQRMEKSLVVADTLESAGDLIQTDLVEQGLNRIQYGLKFSDETLNVIQPLYQRVAEAMQNALRAVELEDQQLALQVIAMKPEIQDLAARASKHLARRLTADEPKRVEVFRVEADIISQISRLYYYAKRIAKIIARDDSTPETGKNAA